MLADQQLVQAMMAESALELYAARLMVLHAAYLIEKGMPFSQEILDGEAPRRQHALEDHLRGDQVHGALGYSTDTPLARMPWRRAVVARRGGSHSGGRAQGPIA